MKLTSTSIKADQPMHLRFAEPGVGGQNISPQLAWSDAPPETRSYAVTVYDPDAPTGSGWWHWLAIDIPSGVASLDEGDPMPEDTVQAPNDYGYLGYGGPWPPPGPAHHYVHTVYALPVESLDIDDETSPAAIRMQLLSKAIDSASITATFQNPESA